MPIEYLVDTANTATLVNECRNPSFEANTVSWTASGLSATRITGGKFGSFDLVCTLGSATTAHVFHSPTVVAFPGEKWTAACWVRNSLGVTRDLRWELRFINSGGTTIATETQIVNLAVSATWTRMVAFGTAPANTASVSMAFYPQATNAGTGNSARLDGVTLIRRPDDAPYVNDLGWYFDGSEDDAPITFYVPAGGRSWNGTSQNSDSTIKAGEWLNVPYLTDLNVNIGRQTDTQPFAASTAEADFRFPLGYVSTGGIGVPGVGASYTKPGAGFRVRREDEPDVLMWQGTVTDSSAEWGPVWDGSAGQADTLKITAEGAFGPWGRRYVEDLVLGTAEDSLETMLFNLSSPKTPAEWVTTHFDAPRIRMASSGNAVFTGYTSDWIQQASATVAAYVRDGGGILQIVSKYDQPDASIEFVDTGASATEMVFDQLKSDSLRENLIELMVIERAVGTVVQLGDGEAFTLATYSTDTTQALALALHYLTRYSVPRFQVTSLSALAEAQTAMELDGLGAPFWQLPGTVVEVTFRTDTVRLVVEGATLTATPDSSRFTYYFSAATTNSYLILDDPVLGTLDNNQLGW